MARRIRIEFSGAFYHVMARGNIAGCLRFLRKWTNVAAICGEAGIGGRRDLRKKMLGLAESAVSCRKSRAYARALELRAHGTQQAERWLAEGLAAAGLSEADLPMLKSTDPCKLALTRLLWQHTTVSQGWLAEPLHLRSATNVSQLLRRVKAAGGERREVLPKGLRQFLRKTPPILKT